MHALKYKIPDAQNPYRANLITISSQFRFLHLFWGVMQKLFSSLEGFVHVYHRTIINMNMLLIKYLFFQTLTAHAILKMERTTEGWQQKTNVCHGTHLH